MKKTMLQYLEARNINYAPVTMTDGLEGIMVDTNYNGEYAPKSVYSLHSDIASKAARLRLQAEPRGSYTALLITTK